ncbi:MAG: hypothetical protein A2V67_06480 [Deltaproteobacteria bacterium RBG_13_61_14]|nr:MAG: hypothetical protein A2V67_06480 [Deltaproteobacteria bacterium RBG_13_61_14]
MPKRVAIVGWAQTRHERRKTLDNDWDLIYPTVKAALKDAGLRHDDIDVCLEGASDYLDGRGISNYTIVDGVGGQLKEEAKVSMDAAYAFIYAAQRLLTGPFEVAIVSGYGKGSESVEFHWQTNTLFDPFYGQPLGLDALSAAGLQASAYFNRFGISEEQAALVPVKNKRNALRNPNAQVKKNLTVEQVMKSPPLCKPIKREDACPISDGAAALVLATEERAKKICRKAGHKPVWLLGMGHCQEAFSLGARDLTFARAGQLAAKRAFQMARIRHPLQELDVAEVYEPFGFQELMWYEALGFCPPGQGAAILEKRVTEMGGRLPVNPSGGALAANPMLATGLVRIIEAAAQVAGRAGKMQVKKRVRRALAAATNGVALQNCAVFVLGGS